MDIGKLLTIRDSQELYNIVDKYYRDNNILHIRLKVGYNIGAFLIFYDKIFWISKMFMKSTISYVSRNENNNKWIKIHIKEFKHYQMMFFFNQMEDES